MTRAARRLRWVVACAVATFLLWLAFRSVEWTRVGDAVRSAEWAWLGLAVVLNAAILPAWAAQWGLFAGRVGRGGDGSGGGDGGGGSRVGDGSDAGGVGGTRFGSVFGVVAVMSTVANSVPFLAGQAAGVHLLATRGGIGHAAALSVLALDQLAEGLAKLTLLALLAASMPLPPGVREAALALAIGVGALALLLVAAAWGRGGWTGRLPGWARGFASAFAAGLGALRSPATLGAGIGLALVMKAAEGGAILAVQRALGVDLPLWATLLALASVALATMVAVAPANLGVYEASAFAAWRLAGVDPDTAAALALLQHAAFLLPAAGVGWLMVALGRVEAGAAEGVGEREAAGSAGGATGSAESA